MASLLMGLAGVVGQMLAAAISKPVQLSPAWTLAALVGCSGPCPESSLPQAALPATPLD